MPDVKYTVSLHYHEYTFINSADAFTFAKLAIYAGDESVTIEIIREEEENEEADK